MSDTPQTLADLCLTLAKRAKAASSHLATVPTAAKNAWLIAAASLLERHTDDLLAANADDVVRNMSAAAQRLTQRIFRQLACCRRQHIVHRVSLIAFHISPIAYRPSL